MKWLLVGMAGGGILLFVVMFQVTNGVTNGIQCPNETVSPAGANACGTAKNAAWTVMAILPIGALIGVIFVVVQLFSSTSDDGYKPKSEAELRREEEARLKAEFLKNGQMVDLRIIYLKACTYYSVHDIHARMTLLKQLGAKNMPNTNRDLEQKIKEAEVEKAKVAKLHKIIDDKSDN